MKIAFFKQVISNTFAPIFEKRLKRAKKQQKIAFLGLEASLPFKKQNFKIIYQCFVFSYLPYIFSPLPYWV